jgi:hypothetical protein
MSTRSMEREVIRRPETKSFLLTSEFWVAGIAAAAVLFAGYVLDDITDGNAWRFLTWIAIGYVISRGIAKAGSQRAYQADPSGSVHNIDGQRQENGQDNRYQAAER